MLLTTASGGIQKSRQPTRYSCIGVRNCVHRYLSKVSAVGPCSTIIPVSHQITAAPARDVPEIEKSTAGRPLPPEGVGPEHTGAGGHRSVRTFWTLSLSFMVCNLLLRLSKSLCQLILTIMNLLVLRWIDVRVVALTGRISATRIVVLIVLLIAC